MGNVTIRPATWKDVVAVYGVPPKRNMKAFAAELDGETVGVAGLYYFPDHIVAFSKAKPEHKHRKMGIVKMTHKMLDLLNTLRVPVFAIADPDIETSGDFLLKVGFEYHTRNENGEIYVWQPQHFK
jgi:hypothetical protein